MGLMYNEIRVCDYIMFASNGFCFMLSLCDTRCRNNHCLGLGLITKDSHHEVSNYLIQYYYLIDDTVLSN